MDHVRMEENPSDNDPTSYVLGTKKILKTSWCNLKVLTALLAVIVILLILALFDVFDSTSTDTDETISDSVESDVLAQGKHFNSEENLYLTGSVAPNILFLLADDIGWADISANGGDFDTPNIDELVTGGIELTNFYSQALCTPSRMAFLTGRYAWKLGVQYPEVIHGMMTGHIPTDEKTFAEVTSEMGYDNYYVGRWGVGYASWDYTPLGRGWDYFMGYFGPEGGYYNHSTDHFKEWLDVYDMWDMTEPYIEANMTYSEDLFYKKTIDYLEQANNAGNPFTLTYASQTAHAPIDDDWPTLYPPIVWSECSDLYMGREYVCNKVKYLDYTWGLIVDYLKNTGMWENMLVFVTSDNGALPYTAQEIWSEWGCNWPLRGGKVTHFEGGIKVWAGLTGGLVPEDHQGTTFDSLTHITDFAATAMRLSMTQTQFNEREELTGTFKEVDGKNIFLFEYHDLIVHNVMPQYIPSWVAVDDFDYGVTDGEWKYMVGTLNTSSQGHGWYNFPGLGVIDQTTDPDMYSRGGGSCSDGCLFHLTSDPNEYVDVSSEYPGIALYFADLIEAIHKGGFDNMYHSGQPYEEDYRGWMADNILRPYIATEAIRDYEDRTRSADSAGNYDYDNYILSYTSDFDGVTSPFDSESG